MKFVSFFFSVCVTIFLIYTLHFPNPMGREGIPALGKLLSPYQGFWQNTGEVSSSQYENLDLPGLLDDVTIVYDDRLVPHIFAQNHHDAYMAQGYVVAQHRLWQMDFVPRAAGGSIAEVLGEKAINYDKQQRRIGMMRSARLAVEAWQKNPEAYALLEAYAAGVNAYIKGLKPKNYPIEYKLMGYAPNEWTPLSTALFARRMAQTLNFRHHDLANSNALKQFGKQAFEDIFPEYNPKQSPVIPEGTPWDFKPVYVEKDTSDGMLSELIPYSNFPMAPEGIGSNNWAVAGNKTASGNPILCNDPHLNLTLPAIWYEMQIHTPEYNAYGVCLPGMPGIIIGFNEHVAWGMTNVGQDVTDWYKIKWANEAKTTYQFDGKEMPVTYEVETFKVKGNSKPVLDSIKYTHMGPIVYENLENGLHGLAMRWLSNSSPNPLEMETFLGLNRAKSYEDYITALANYDFPAQNFAFASKSGDIAITVNGKFPIKNVESGRFIEDGSTEKSQWKGFIPHDQIPKIKNPERGFIASANQNSTAPDYPYYYYGGFDDYRGRTINAALEKMSGITTEDMKNLQLSNFSILAQEGNEVQLRLLDKNQLNDTQLEWIGWLEQWDLKFDGKAKAPIIFWEWLQNTYRGLWDEVLPLSDSMEIQTPEWWRTIEMMEKDTASKYWDIVATSKVETPSEIVTQAFLKTYDELKEKFASENYNWEQHRGTYIAHLAQLAPFGRFNLPVGGFEQAPNAINKSHGPSWRMVVELGNEIKGYGVYPGGQSGNPASPYYDNMVDQWVNGEYNELWFMHTIPENDKKVLFSQTLKKAK